MLNDEEKSFVALRSGRDILLLLLLLLLQLLPCAIKLFVVIIDATKQYVF
jgi:hypothetical protein